MPTTRHINADNILGRLPPEDHLALLAWLDKLGLDGGEIESISIDDNNTATFTYAPDPTSMYSPPPLVLDWQILAHPPPDIAWNVDRTPNLPPSH